MDLTALGCPGPTLEASFGKGERESFPWVEMAEMHLESVHLWGSEGKIGFLHS